MKKILPALATVIIVTTACSSASGGQSESTETALTAAYKKCNDETITVADDGHTLLIDTGSEGSVDGVACLAIELGTSERLVSQMDSTNSLMGRQTAEEGGYTYAWSYHPDNGLQMTITDQ